MLKRIVIENYRSCLRTSFDCHPNLSVLIGPNSSGKTNILQAILFLNKLAQEPERRPSYEETITESSRIKALFSFGRKETQLNASIAAYTDESNNDIILASQQKWLLMRLDGKHVSSEFPLFAASHLSERRMLPNFLHFHSRHFPGSFYRMKTELPKWAILRLSNISQFCEGIRYYGASQFTNPGACPVSFEIEEEGERRRLFRPRGHTKILYQMYSAHKSEDRRRYEQFLNIVGPDGLRLIEQIKFKEVPTSSVEYTVRVGGKVKVHRLHKLLVIPQFRIGKQRLSPNQLSEGTFKTLALLFYVITENSTALLIEEPEVCIHHGLLSSILELIKTYSRHKQMIVSTHSDYVLDHVRPENVFRVTFDKLSGTIVRHIRKTMTAREYTALREYLEKEGNLGEFWREGGLGDRR
jgi:energy-coupling factor transporter ATP-binding protein EcfA2